MTVRRWLHIVVAVVVCAALYAAYSRYFSPDRPVQDAGRTRPGVPVTTMTAELKSFPVVITGLGTVQPYNSVTARTRVDGEVVKILFKEGDIVKEGDLLAQIDPRPYQAAVDQAMAKKAQDEATLRNAELDLKRYQTLALQNAVSHQTLDTQVAAVAQNTALVAGDVAAIETAQTNLDYTHIRAPLTGRVGFRLVDQGNIVNAASQTGIVTITQVQPITVILTVPERQLGELYAAMNQRTVAAAVYTPDGARKLADGKLAVINNQVDSTTGTLQIKATFENLDNALWPGLAVVVRIPIRVLDQVVVLPQTAVQHSQQGLSTYVVDDKQVANFRSVEIGPGDNDNVVVTRGVAPGDRVVVSGQYRLQNGAKVTASNMADGGVGRRASNE
jgi:multidrug efflux system membrane fusion protein